MGALFAALSTAVQGNPALALGAAVLWGVLSVVLSPCHLATLPLIIGFIGEQGRTSTRYAFTLSLLFALGLLVTLALLGALTAALGRLLGDVGPWSRYFVAAVLLVMGLHLLGVIPLPLRGANPGAMRRRGLLAALLLGLVFGLALGPCTFAYLAPMLAVVAGVAASAPAYAVGLLLAFGLGHAAVLVAAGTSTGWVQRYLHWSETSRATTVLRQVCGVLVILGGLYLLYTA